MLSIDQLKMGAQNEVERDLRPESPLWSAASGLSSKRRVVVRMV